MRRLLPGALAALAIAAAPAWASITDVVPQPTLEDLPDKAGSLGSFERATGQTGQEATRGAAGFVLHAPRLGVAYSQQPVLRWTFDGQALGFTVVVRDQSDDEVWRARVDHTEFRYPPDAPPLQPGKSYSWRVEAQPPLGQPRLSDQADLRILGQPGRDTIDKALSRFDGYGPRERLRRRARVFIDTRCWYDALAALDDLIARDASEVAAYEFRGALYDQIEWTKPLAEQDFAKADELAGRSGQTR